MGGFLILALLGLAAMYWALIWLILEGVLDGFFVVWVRLRVVEYWSCNSSFYCCVRNRCDV